MPRASNSDISGGSLREGINRELTAREPLAWNLEWTTEFTMYDPHPAAQPPIGSTFIMSNMHIEMGWDLGTALRYISE